MTSGIRVIVGLLLTAPISTAQLGSFGIKGGVPLTEVLEAKGRIGDRQFLSQTRHFTIGPVLEVRLPAGLSVEVNALYKRFEQSGGSITAGERVRKSGSSWEFPLLGKYRFAGTVLARPYVEGGVTFHRISDVLQPFRTLPSPPANQPTGSETRRGIAVGGGLELKLAGIRVSAGIRYSHWGEGLVVPSTKLADFLVGVVF